MDINVSCYYDDNYEIINGMKVRVIKIEGPYAHMLPDRTNDSKNTKKESNSFINKIKNGFSSKKEA